MATAAYIFGVLATERLMAEANMVTEPQVDRMVPTTGYLAKAMDEGEAEGELIAVEDVLKPYSP